MEALNSFEANLAEIARIADHVEGLLAERSASEDLVLPNAIARSGLVLLCGYFEGFLRELVQEAVDEINDAGVGVNELPDRLFLCTLEAAAKKSGPKRDNAFLFIRDRIRDGQQCALDKKHLSSTGGNPTVDTIEGLLQGFGITAVIDLLSVRDFEIDSTFTVERQSKAVEGAVIEAIASNDQDLVERILRVIDERWLPKKRRRSVGYVSAIEELLKRRNRIAHGEGSEVVTPEELRQQAVVIGRLAAGLSKLIEDVLDGLLITPAPTAP